MQKNNELQGFRKIDPDRWEFANEGFLRGQRHLLRMIKRRRPPSYLAVASQQQQALGSYLKVGHYGGLEEEMDRLKRDKNVLLAEVVKLRQEQQSTRADVRAMEERLRRAESKQMQMMRFLARAMQNPDFFRQLLPQNQHRRRELEDALFSKKRPRRPIDIVPFAEGTKEAQQQQKQSEELDSAFLFGPSPSGREFEEPGSSELENLALNIQGLGNRKHDHQQGRNNNQQGGQTAELTDDFWEELLNEGMKGKGELSVPEMERMTRRPSSGRHVDVLAQKLSHMSK